MLTVFHSPVFISFADSRCGVWIVWETWKCQWVWQRTGKSRGKLFIANLCLEPCRVRPIPCRSQIPDILIPIPEMISPIVWGIHTLHTLHISYVCFKTWGPHVLKCTYDMHMQWALGNIIKRKTHKTQLHALFFGTV